MSEALSQNEVWSVKLRDSEDKIFEKDVRFLHYVDGTIDESLVESDVGADGGYVVSLFTCGQEELDAGAIPGILVSKFPSDLEDAVYGSLCHAVTDGPAPAMFGMPFNEFTAERIRDGINTRADDPYAQL